MALDVVVHKPRSPDPAEHGGDVGDVCERRVKTQFAGTEHSPDPGHGNSEQRNDATHFQNHFSSGAIKIDSSRGVEVVLDRALKRVVAAAQLKCFRQAGLAEGAHEVCVAALSGMDGLELAIDFD